MPIVLRAAPAHVSRRHFENLMMSDRYAASVFGDTPHSAIK